MRVLLLVPLLTLALPLAAVARAAPSPYQEIDQYALDTPKAAEQSIAKLAAYFGKQAKTPEQKARVIYRWVADRIAYDAETFFAGKTITATDPERVLMVRKTSCFGYSTLYERIARQMGLEVVTLHGHCRGYGYKPGEKVWRNHSWNAVKIDGQWKLLDMTFGSGVVDPAKGFLKQFEDYYFFTPPEQFIFNHFPENPKAQMLKTPVSAATYQSWPNVRFQLFKAGVPLKAVQDAIAKKDFGDIVLPFDDVSQDTKFVEIPLEKNLKAGESYTFKLQVPEGAKLAVIQNRESFTDFKKRDDRWEATVTAEKGTLHIGVQYPDKGSDYLTLLEYTVGAAKDAGASSRDKMK